MTAILIDRKAGQAAWTDAPLLCYFPQQQGNIAAPANPVLAGKRD